MFSYILYFIICYYFHKYNFIILVLSIDRIRGTEFHTRLLRYFHIYDPYDVILNYIIFNNARLFFLEYLFNQ